MKCTLPGNINKCPHCDRETTICGYDQKCSFQESSEQPKNNGYVRKERWYEKMRRERKEKK